MGQKRKFYTLDEVCLSLGLEKSRVRFIEREFGTFFGFSRLSPGPTLYSRKQRAVIEKIGRLLKRPDLTVDQIKNRFHRLCLERGKGIWVIAVASGKGGVGKTFLSTNLSVLFARRGLRTVLLDADFGLANDHVFLGIDPNATLLDLLNRKVTLEDLLVEGPCGMKLIPGGSGVFQLAEIMEHQRDYLVEEMLRLRGMTDILVVDTAAGVSRNVLHLLGLADEILIVSTPNIASILDAFGLIRIAVQQKTTGALNLIVNRVRNPAEADHAKGRIAQCADRLLGRKVTGIGSIPEDPLVEKSIQDRSPLVLQPPPSGAASGLEGIARRLIRERTIWKGEKRNRLNRLFARLVMSS